MPRAAPTGAHAAARLIFFARSVGWMEENGAFNLKSDSQG
jgi:hypothetical protein